MKIVKILNIVLMMAIGLHAQAHYEEQSLPTTEAGGANAVSMSGNFLALGAYDENFPGNPNKTCYVDIYEVTDYTANPITWTHKELLGGAKGNCNGNKGFGSAISMSGDFLAISTTENNGEVRLYKYDAVNDTWDVTPLVYTNPEQTQIDTGFGEALSILGSYLIVGAPRYNNGTTLGAGRVYVYDVNTINGLTTLTGTYTDGNFGASVTAKDLKSGVTRIVIGETGYDVGINTNEGATYVYEYSGTGAPALREIFIGRTPNDGVGIHVATGENEILSSGENTLSFTTENGIDWMDGISLSITLKGDVSISNSVSAVGYLGRTVHVYPSIKDNKPSLAYYTAVSPTNKVIGETVEDISFDRDQLLVKQGTSEAAFVYDFPCGHGTELVENTWTMIGVPCAVPNGTTVGEAFNHNTSTITGDALGTYGENNNWVVYEQNSTYGGTSASYRLMDENDTVVQGKGYWIICDHNVTTRVDSTVSSQRPPLFTTLAGAGVGATTIQSLPDANVTEGFTKVLLANELSRPIHWGNVFLGADGITVVQMGTTGSLAILDQATAYVYDETQSGQPYRAITTTPGFDDTIEPGEGYWVKILAPSTNVSIALPFEK